MPSRIKDSNHLLDIFDNINSIFLPHNAIVVIFDIVNMFHNIGNKSGLDAVKSVLLKSSTKTPPTGFILERGGTVQVPHLSCSYKGIAVFEFDTAALQYHFQPTPWKRFRDNIMTICTHVSDTLESFLEYLNHVRLNSSCRYKVKMGLTF